jgi:hypothetical protein
MKKIIEKKVDEYIEENGLCVCVCVCVCVIDKTCSV